jgi:hypothetical protein
MLPVNPEGERIRAQSILRSFTEYENAVDTFASMSRETAAPAARSNRNVGWSITRVFKAIELKSRAILSDLSDLMQSREGCENC